MNFDKNDHLHRIPVAVKSIHHHLCMLSEILESDKLYPFLPSGGTQLADKEYLESLEPPTGLIVCTEEQIQKLTICFDKKYIYILKTFFIL